MERLTRKEYQTWKSNPLTQKVMSILQEQVQQREIALSKGSAIGRNDSDDIALNYMAEVNFIRGIRQVMDNLPVEPPGEEDE